MATNQHLETEFKVLREELKHNRQSTLRVKDDIAELKGNYSTLIAQLNKRLESIEESFRSFAKK